MGQNQSIEEPYHRRHYNATHQHLLRQNSLRSMSTPNLLPSRDPSTPQRAGSFFSPNSPALPSSHQPRPAPQHQPPQRRGSFASSIGSFITSTGSFAALRGAETPTFNKDTESNSAGNSTTPILRLLPIHNEPKYYDETDDSDTDSEDDEEGEGEHHHRNNKGGEEDNALTKQRAPQPYNRGITASPSYLDRSLNLHSFEHLPRDKAEFHRTKAEEKEDLAHLSPTSGAPTIDHSHPRYFDDGQQGEEPVIKRYQLYDPPVPASLFANLNKEPDAQDRPQPEELSIPSAPSRPALMLEIIQEEDEGGHSRRPSQMDQEDSDSDSDYKDDDDSEYDMMEISRIGPHHDTQPLQETNHTRTTEPSVEDLYGEVRTDLDKHIQRAMQQVEQQLADRVHRLEEQTAHKLRREQGQDLDQNPLDAEPNRHARGTIASRREILSNTSQHVDDLDTRVNAMEYLVSYKLNDIESKVQELHEGQGVVAQSMKQVPSTSEGEMSNEMERYHQPLDLSNIDNVELMEADALVDKASITEIRQELQAFGMRYHELNNGLLTELMAQLREAKLMLYENADDVDQRLGRRVDRIEAEMHAKRLTDIENRVQERVRAMEQTSTRLERCFEKMEGRLGALETVLASKRVRDGMNQTMQPSSLPQSDLSGRTPSPESPRPTQSDNGTASPRSSPIQASSSSNSASTFRSNAPRPLWIQTSGQTARLNNGPQSAGPMSRTRERAMTIDNLSAATPTAGATRRASFAHPTLESIGTAGPKSAGYVVSSTSSRPATPKIVRRPSGYKELLHFWKAGGSTPDLLRGATNP